MRRIKPRGNRSTELLLLQLLRRARISGWRRHGELTGRPDFVFRIARLVVFVDGDFWHGNPATFKLPRTNSGFWQAKIQYNRSKDLRVSRTLRKQGWTVIRIWESTLRKKPAACVARVRRALNDRTQELRDKPLLRGGVILREKRGNPKS